MTSTNLYDPEEHARRLAVRVTEGHLPAGVFGCWDPRERVVWLDARLSSGQRRSTLAHELVHAERGGVECATDVLRRREESMVEQLAATRLISVEALADAVRWSADVHEQADHLSVDVDMLLARLEALPEHDLAHIDRCRRAAEGGAA